VAIRDERGLYWPWEAGNTKHSQWYGLSFIPGAAGIAHFLLSLYQETKEARWADVAREAGETLRRQAVPDHGGLNWPDTLDGLSRGEALQVQWCSGAPGVGIFFAKAFEAFGDPKDLETAEAAGECTFQYGDVRRNACQCHGLAGNGELLIDLYHATCKQLWLDRAHDFARRVFAYRRVTPAGDEWQADDAGFYSPEFMLGAAGTGHFFLRLWQRGTLSRPLL
jgi:class IV lanthipeptide synthase